MAENLGITVKKSENFSEWYTQVIQKAQLIEYSPVSGCYILRPYAYAIWERVQTYIDEKIKAKGVKNAYFPMFIPESLLRKESEHVAGFSPEVAWVTEAGDTKLNERLAIRPTSETIMYPAFAKWIRSHKDLPLRLNQWSNVCRWEFKNPVPFLRSREFLWQEGHTAFATKEEADAEVREILDLYTEVFETLYAVPVFKGTKSEKEKFAGALYTTSIETFLPTGKAIQGATSHCLGQNFARVFDITFLDEKGEKQYVWQNSWGLTTRSIGIMVIMHGDDKGLILPPEIAPIQAVIVPIIFDEKKKEIQKKVQEIQKTLKDVRVHIDTREEHTPGWKFNEWEVKGVPLRIELGPRDITTNQAIVVRRDTGTKHTIPLKDLKTKIPELLALVQKNLYRQATARIEKDTITARTFTEIKNTVAKKKLVKMLWCTRRECEEKIKEGTGGAKSLIIPFDQKPVTGTCGACAHDANVYAFFAKSY